jgi:ornithine cyclodeaminase/alanine dehydrogenase
MYEGTLILSRSQVAGLLDLPTLIGTMEAAFRSRAEGGSIGTGLLHFDSTGGLEFHLKAGGLAIDDKVYFGVKINGASFQNTERFGLPNILGAIALFDGECGYPIAIMDSVTITIRRTGATTAAAANYLAKQDSSVATICGCGKQGRIQLQALKEVLPITTVHAHDANPDAMDVYSAEMSELLGIDVYPAPDLGQAAGESDVIVTCTPSKQAYLMKDHVRPGTFVAAVGADSPDKQELDENLFPGNKVVADIVEQCARVGELHHAIDAGLMTANDIHAELGQVFAGQKAGRESDDEIIIYDATGTALQDTAAAYACYKNATAGGIGTIIDLLG